MLWFDTTIFTLTLIQAIRLRRYFPGGMFEMLFRDGEYSFPVTNQNQSLQRMSRNYLLRVSLVGYAYARLQTVICLSS